jgi:hypothetical protein
MDSALGTRRAKTPKQRCALSPRPPFLTFLVSLVSCPCDQTCEAGGVNGSGYSGGALLLAGDTDVTLTDFGFRDNLALKVCRVYIIINALEILLHGRGG